VGASFSLAALSAGPADSPFPVMLAVLGLGFEYVAVTELKKQKRQDLWLWCPPLVMGLIFLWFGILDRNVSITMLLFNVIRLTMMVRIGMSFFRAESGSRMLLDTLASGVFALLSLFTFGIILDFFRSGHFALEYDFNSQRTMYNIMASIVAQSVVCVLFFLGLKERSNDEFKYMALHDPLTNLLNRRGMEEVGFHLVSGMARTAQPMSLFMIDIDHFKKVNDGYGHAIGDFLLKSAADGLRSAIRKEDYLARWGGDEFCVLLPGAMRNQAEAVAERVLKVFQELDIEIDGAAIRLSVSIGIVTKEEEGVEFASLMRQADAALYQVKASGRCGFLFAQGIARS
jgi:diguanylate cyclase (GGDEF)-like protein